MTGEVVESSRFSLQAFPGPAGRAAALAVGMILASASCRASPGETGGARAVLVFAASSLQTVTEALAGPIRDATGIVVRPSYAASSVLARQIERGAPADLFISADPAWIDYLRARRLTTDAVPIAGNRLVLIAPRDRPVALSISPGFPLAAAIGPDRLALGDPATVPAGHYARAALTSLGVWETVSTRLAPGASVRTVLRQVALGEAPLGIVYETDARADPQVVVVDRFPASSHAPIVYTAARTAAAADDAGVLLAFLQGSVARAVLQREGFTLP